MDKILVTYASRMGSTGEIAEAIGAVLSDAGLEVDVLSVQQAKDSRNYAAVILGSSIYYRQWDKDAVLYLKSQAPDLAERPVWLFQSGPCGDDVAGRPFVAPATIKRLIAEIGIENPLMVFGGNLDPSRARDRIAKWVTQSNLAGDSRDFEEIRRWASSIATELKQAGLGAGGDGTLDRSAFDSASS